MASRRTAVAQATKALVIHSTEDSLQHCCGVGEIGGFDLIESSAPPKFPGDDATKDQLQTYYFELERWLEEDKSEEADIQEFGTGYFVATFNNSEESKFAFTRLQELGHELVFEADPRKNGPNGNPVSVAIFLHKDAVKRDAEAAARRGARRRRQTENSF